MRRLRSYFTATALVSSIVVSTALYGVLYYVLEETTQGAVERASLEVADATFSCARALMGQGLSGPALTSAIRDTCETSGIEGLATRHYDVRLYSVRAVEAGSSTHAPGLVTAVRSGKSVRSGTAEVLEASYAIHATRDCLGCHPSSAEGDVLGALQVNHHMADEMAQGRKSILFLLLLLLPIPIIGALITAAVIGRRIRKSVSDVESIFPSDQKLLGSGKRTPAVQLDFEEFNELYGRLVDKLNLVTDDLRLHVNVLGKLMLSPEAARDWKKEVTRILSEIREFLPIQAVCFLFAESEKKLGVDIFWGGQPSFGTRRYLLETLKTELKSGPHGEHLKRFEVIDSFTDPEKSIPELSLAEVSRDFRIQVRDRAGVGALLGVGMLVQDSKSRSSASLNSVLTALFTLGGSLRELFNYTLQVERFTTTDPVTRLYNLKMFWELFERDVRRAERQDQELALVIMDFDNFKTLNDKYGHGFGDEYLKSAGGVLRTLIRETDVLARNGGDEFSVIAHRAGVEQAFLISKRIIEEFREHKIEAPDGSKVGITVSIGAAVFPTHAQNAKEIYRIADTQMYKAKSQGRNRACMPDSGEQLVRFRGPPEKSELIRDAIEKDLIVPYFQPVVDVRNREVVAHEVLMRVALPSRIVEAGEFIKAAEEMGLINQLDLIVFGKALRLLKERGLPGQIFLNLSPRALVFEGFIKDTMKLVEENEVPPQKIIFELSEKETVKNRSLLADFVRGLREVGFGFAVDNFQAGFSSLQHLRQMPIDMLKIDGSVISTWASGEDENIVPTIANLALGLGIKTIAQRVETEEAFKKLRKAGVDYAQGNYTGRPAADVS